MKMTSSEEIEKINRDFLTVKEVAAGMGISRQLFYKVVDAVPFPVLKIGRAYKIPKQPFISFLKTGEIVKPDNSQNLEKSPLDSEAKIRR